MLAIIIIIIYLDAVGCYLLKLNKSSSFSQACNFKLPDKLQVKKH